jgi:hypothetical protein
VEGLRIARNMLCSHVNALACRSRHDVSDSNIGLAASSDVLHGLPWIFTALAPQAEEGYLNTPAAGGTGAPTIEASLAPTLGLEPLQPGTYIDRSHPKRPRNWHET